MRIIRSHSPCPPTSQQRVVTIGAFDGLHRGHHALLMALDQVAQPHHATRALVTFEPLPHEYFASTASKAPARLMCLRERAQWLAQSGLIDELWILRFNATLSVQSAPAFVEQFLIHKLNAKHIVIGDDFLFGHQGNGNAKMLTRYGKQYDFSVTEVSTQCEQGMRISSTRIRTALAAGDFALAETLLGRPYSMQGTVGYGRQLARTWGFPTINLRLKRQVLPLIGVFVVEVECAALASRLSGVANIGFRPTVDGIEPRLEVHLFDFQGDLYQQPVTVFFRHRLRNEIKFPSLDALQQQIKRDVIDARQWLFDAQAMLK